jgi:bifunctional non-homologous end joining protein LigD
LRRRDIARRRVTWTDPELMAQVGFTEWTSPGRVRPRCFGLRYDKPARELVREDADPLDQVN